MGSKNHIGTRIYGKILLYVKADEHIINLNNLKL